VNVVSLFLLARDRHDLALGWPTRQVFVAALDGSDQVGLGDDIVAVKDASLWPLSAIATRSGTPPRIILRTLDRRRSWTSSLPSPAFAHAALLDSLQPSRPGISRIKRKRV
jgi:hypothetical protein